MDAYPKIPMLQRKQLQPKRKPIKNPKLHAKNPLTSGNNHPNKTRIHQSFHPKIRLHQPLGLPLHLRTTKKRHSNPRKRIL